MTEESMISRSQNIFIFEGRYPPGPFIDFSKDEIEKIFATAEEFLKELTEK